jgi:DNA invertase Pin-like site-specific DNA recombinase
MNACLSPSHPAMGLSNGGKIQRHHLERLAVVYVRQSTMQQVDRHQESTRLQYGLVERAVDLGWSRSQVLLIDDDLGRSGTTAEGRPGFQRLVAEVGLDHVGIVLGIEISRLARSSRDWYQLLEVCAVFATLIADADGVYDPMTYNDRLLLGLKGTMSEAELHILKQRMLEGKRAKARRGELGMRVPMGYIRHASGEVMKDPDEQARAVIDLVFHQFARSGTINAVLQHLVRHDIRLPVRVVSGAQKGELTWHRPNRATLSNLLHHPVYAGAYVYGRRPTDARRKKPGRASTGRTVAKPEQWEVLIKDRFPAYISWAQYERNQRQLDANRAQALGTPRQGPSLLSGLLICGRCGLRMATQYNNNGRGLRYVCSRLATDYGEPLCQSLAGAPLDALIGDLVLQALEPSALELSLKLAEDLEAERARDREQWEQRLERAHFEAERFHRQYDAVEPENRLVARTLERQWEEALAAEERLSSDYARFLDAEPTPLSPAERARIRRLAENIPALWSAATTTAAERQAIVRQLVERVIATVVGESEQVNVEIHWAGGRRTRTRIARPVARLEQLSYYPELLERVVCLQQEGFTDVESARRLNAEGWRPAKRRATFNAPMVANLLTRRGLGSGSARQQYTKTLPRDAEEWTLKELALELEMPPVTLNGWIRKGQVRARQVRHAGHTLWLLWADKAELERLRALRTAPRPWARHGPIAQPASPPNTG